MDKPKLKSTYRPAPPPAVQPTTQPQLPPLPEGWTEHTAPDGRPYYFHASTNKSTYSRPFSQPERPPIPSHIASQFSGGFPNENSAQPDFISLNDGGFPEGSFRGGRGGSISRRGFQERKKQLSDKPKHTYKIPGCAPWVLVKTKLGRRFVHNKETGVSLWKFPEDVEKGVIQWDRRELEKKLRRERGEPNDDEEEENVTAQSVADAPKETNNQSGEGSDSEYTEIEVTDSEAEDGEEDDEARAKRQRTDDERPHNGPVEFNEDDIEWQLQAMGEEHGLDPGEYGMDEDLDEGEEGLPLSDEEANLLFCEMLNEHAINPFHTWEQIIEDGRIIEDSRYTVLPNMKSRRDCYAGWSKEKIKEQKQQKGKKMEKQDPRILFLEFLQAHAKPKEYWPEFRKKWRKESVINDDKLPDKDRANFYREHIKNLQKPEATRRKELLALLKTLSRPLKMAALPPELLRDIR